MPCAALGVVPDPVLVTGAMGQVGQLVTALLVDRGRAVIALDLPTAGAQVGARRPPDAGLARGLLRRPPGRGPGRPSGGPAALCCLRFFTDARGRTVVERGLDQVRGGLVRQQATRFLGYIDTNGDLVLPEDTEPPGTVPFDQEN